MKAHATLGAFIGAAALAYALFWLANKAVLLNYNPDAAQSHWMVRYFLPLGIVDALLPTLCLIIAARTPSKRTLWIALGAASLLALIAFQELTLAEHAVQTRSS